MRSIDLLPPLWSIVEQHSLATKPLIEALAIKERCDFPLFEPVKVG